MQDQILEKTLSKPRTIEAGGDVLHFDPSHGDLRFQISQWLFPSKLYKLHRDDQMSHLEDALMVFELKPSWWWLSSLSKCRVHIAIDKGHKNKFVVRLSVLSKRISQNHVSKILKLLEELFTARLLEEINLNEARNKQQTAFAALSNQEEKNRRAREVDKIVNPDKYKKKSSTVRLPSGDSRYRPSAASKARERTKRG